MNEENYNGESVTRCFTSFVCNVPATRSARRRLWATSWVSWMPTTMLMWTSSRMICHAAMTLHLPRPARLSCQHRTGTSFSVLTCKFSCRPLYYYSFSSSISLCHLLVIGTVLILLCVLILFFMCQGILDSLQSADVLSAITARYINVLSIYWWNSQAI